MMVTWSSWPWRWTTSSRVSPTSSRSLIRARSRKVETLLPLAFTMRSPLCSFPRASLSEEMETAFDLFHNFMFDAVYRNLTAKGEEGKVLGILRGIFEYYVHNPDALPREYRRLAEEDGLERAVCDYVAGMTDTYALTAYSDIYIPAAWAVK